MLDRDSSPEVPREVNEEEYIKIAAKRRIRKVRKTLYEDPGNPFNVGDVETGQQSQAQDGDPSTLAITEPPRSLNSSKGVLRSESQAIIADDDYTSSDESINPFIEKEERASREETQVLYHPSPQRTGTPNLIKKHSIPLAREPSSYVPPRSLWKKGDQSLPNPGFTSLPNVKDADDARRTRFYDFYDDVLAEYATGERLAGVRHSRWYSAEARI